MSGLHVLEWNDPLSKVKLNFAGLINVLKTRPDWIGRFDCRLVGFPVWIDFRVGLLIELAKNRLNQRLNRRPFSPIHFLLLNTELTNTTLVLSLIIFIYSDFIIFFKV